LQSLNGFADRGKICEHSAWPTVGCMILSAADRLFFDGAAKLFLRADKKKTLSFGCQTLGGVQCIFGKLLSFFKIDNVDSIALHEDVWLHLRIPAAGKMPKMST